jgi:hypothetical protein
VQRGDLLWVGSLPSDPNQAREFSTFDQYAQECSDNRRPMIIPFDCCIQRRMSDGVIETLVDEDLYQELQKKTAEQRAAETLNTDQEKKAGENEGHGAKNDDPA